MFHSHEDCLENVFTYFLLLLLFSKVEGDLYEKYECIATLQMESSALSVQWNTTASVLAVSSESGSIQLFRQNFKGVFVQFTSVSSQGEE